MTNLKSSILIGFSVLSLAAFSAKAGNGKQDGSQYTLTTKQLSPKQFSKGYKAERMEHKGVQSSSTRKMKKRLKGTWLQRWFSRNR
jgi:hypothetical protein